MSYCHAHVPVSIYHTIPHFPHIMKRYPPFIRDVVQDEEVEITNWKRGHTMASNVQRKDAQHDVAKVAKTAEKDVKPLQQFLTKFNNDWVMNFAAALAYNLLMAIFPIAIAIIVILGLILGNLNHQAYINVQAQLIHAFPGTLSSGVIDSITLQLKRDTRHPGHCCDCTCHFQRLTPLYSY